MSPQGTAAYDALTDLPPLVERAVGLARRLGFAHSRRPEHGRLLHALAAGAGTIGETGTGCDGSPTPPWTPPNSGWPPTWPPSSPPAASLLADRGG
jgi:hypothetical protein